MEKGQTVQTIRPSGKTPKGATGVVFWLGEKWGHDRCGFKSGSDTFWAKVDDCIVTDATVKAVASAPKKSSGPRVFARMKITRITGRAIQANGHWWPKSQAFDAGDGWVCATEWIVKQKFDGVIPQCWMTKAGKEAWEATQAVSEVVVPVTAPIQPPAGSWAATARAMAKGDDSGMDWDAWKDEMKEAALPAIEVTEADVSDVLCGLFAD